MRFASNNYQSFSCSILIGSGLSSPSLIIAIMFVCSKFIKVVIIK